jgi:phage terminase large subunit-like protein
MGIVSEGVAGAVDHVGDALAYAQEVVAGLIPACKWVKAACRRQLDDLEREQDPTWPYEWRRELADRVIRFIELLPHVKGPLAGEPLRLERWQKFGIACVFGWVRKTDGRRRFRTVYDEEPRKNAKTTKLAGIGLYMLVADDELGAEVYSAATKEEQARIVFEIAQQMARMEPEFRAHFGVEIYRKALAVRDTASKFRPLAADADSLDGLNVSCALIDELHAHKTRAVHDVLDSGTGSRAQPLIWKITTAGSNRAGVCYDQRNYLTKILNAVLKRHGGMGYRIDGECVDNENFWGIIYTVDEGDDLFDEATWRKANPNWGVSVEPDDMRRMAAVARVQAQALNEFLTKRLNVWVNADSAWMNMLEWDACGDLGLRLEDFKSEECVVALDAAFKKDLFAKVRMFRRLVDEVAHYYVFGRYYTNADLVEQKGNEHLQGWLRDGWIRATPGNVLDIEAVREELLEDTRAHQVLEVPFDPAQLTQFATEMLDEGLLMVEIRPTVLNFSAAMKEVEELVASRRLHHQGDPVLGWAIANVVCHRDAKDNIYPRKDDAAKKIDPAIALFMSMARWLANPVPVSSVYEAAARARAAAAAENPAGGEPPAEGTQA